MKIKTIKIRTDLKQSYVRDYLSKFFRNTKFRSNYIYILTKISLDSGNLVYNIGEKMIVDVTDKNEISTYKEILIFHYLRTSGLLKTTKPDLKIDQLLFYYMETDNETYVKYQNAISLSKYFDLP